MTDKKYSAVPPTRLASFSIFVLLVITLGAYSFYFLYDEANRISNRFPEHELRFGPMILIVGVAYLVSVIAYHWIYYTAVGASYSDLNSLLSYVSLITSVSYILCLAFAYKYLLLIQKIARVKFEKSVGDLIFLILFGVLFVSIRQNFLPK